MYEVLAQRFTVFLVPEIMLMLQYSDAGQIWSPIVSTEFRKLL